MISLQAASISQFQGSREYFRYGFFSKKTQILKFLLRIPVTELRGRGHKIESKNIRDGINPSLAFVVEHRGITRRGPYPSAVLRAP